MKIFVVDNDNDDLEIFSEALREVAPHVECLMFDDPLKAIAKLELDCPDFLFLDYRMPDIDGKEFILRIRTYPCFSSTKIIMYSTYMGKNEWEDCKSLGAFQCWTKRSTFQGICEQLSSFFKTIS